MDTTTSRELRANYDACTHGPPPEMRKEGRGQERSDHEATASTISNQQSNPNPPEKPQLVEGRSAPNTVPPNSLLNREFSRTSLRSNLRRTGTAPETNQFDGNDPDPQSEPDAPPDNSHLALIREPETRSISQEQLEAEVRCIYAGLAMVESKCIEVDNAQNSQKDSPHKLNIQQWQALISLHRTLLHEYHDFFLASQHPSSSLALQRLASKYSMPARMWRHGIHSFLELLRHRLPASLEHMLTFIYLAYSMMALLYETVPAFEDIWIECLGDLGRYRMAIEDDNLHDREIWAGVSRHWYSYASNRAPTTGRLYHHLAILARPNAVQQLFLYVKSLSVPTGFSASRKSIMTLFEPVLADKPNALSPIDTNYIRLHSILFTGKSLDRFGPSLNEFKNQLDTIIAKSSWFWMETGTYIAISNVSSLLGYCSDSNEIFKALRLDRRDYADVGMQGVEVELIKADTALDRALDLNIETQKIILSRIDDQSTYPYLHVVLASLYRFMQVPAVMLYVQERMQFGLMAEMLNILASACDPTEFQSAKFPSSGPKDIPRPLPEDYSMRGLVWTEKYFPEQWFSHSHDADEERMKEVASTGEQRKLRCLWLGVRIAEVGRGNKGHHLGYDAAKNSFFAVNAPPNSVATSKDGEDRQPVVENTMPRPPGPNDLSRASTWVSKTMGERDESKNWPRITSSTPKTDVASSHPRGKKKRKRVDEDRSFAGPRTRKRRGLEQAESGTDTYIFGKWKQYRIRIVDGERSGQKLLKSETFKSAGRW